MAPYRRMVIMDALRNTWKQVWFKGELFTFSCSLPNFENATLFAVVFCPILNSAACVHPQVPTSGPFQEIDVRLSALDYLSDWAQKNSLPKQWLQELSVTRQHAEEYMSRDPKVVIARCLRQQGY